MEYGFNIFGIRLVEVCQVYIDEIDFGLWCVKVVMLVGMLFNWVIDIFWRLVELQGEGVEICSDDVLMCECGNCLFEVMEFGCFVLYCSGDEGIDELWGELFWVFLILVEDFYESCYIKIGQSMCDIDKIVDVMVVNFM